MSESESNNQVSLTQGVSNDTITADRKNKIYSSVPSWVPITSILIITALIYSRALFNTLTNFDDNDFILHNTLIQDFNWEGIKAISSSFQSGKYQPIVNLSFLLEYKLSGFNPVVFHLDNVLLHLVCTWLTYKFTFKLSGKKITALVVAVLFALHPMHVEDVAWASERKDVLYAVFYLLSLLYYMKYLESGLRIKYYVWLFLFFVIALFSKSSAITLPLVLIAIDIYKGRKLNVGALLEKVPIIVLAVVFMVLGAHSRDAGGVNYHLQPPLSFFNRIFFITSVPSFYIVKLFAPFGLSAMHYYPDVYSGVLPWAYYASLPFLLAIILIVWLLVRRSAFRKEMAFGVAFFAITISVMEQIISSGPALTPERYTYIPYIGFFYIAGQWLSSISDNKGRRLAFGIFGLFTIMFSVQTWMRIAAWKDSDSIFNDVLEHNEGNPDCFYIYLMRGDLRMAEGNLRDALLDYNLAVASNPVYAESFNNRGVALFQAGDLKSALVDFNAAIRLNPARPKQYNNRASLKASMGDFNGAFSDYNYYLQLQPTDGRAYADRGMVRLNLRDSSGACTDWKKAAELGNENAPQLLHQFCH